MAKAKTEATPSKDGKAKKKGKLGLYTTLTVAVFAAPFMFPTVVLLMIGLLPTMFAFFIDKDNQHSSATSIGAMNFAGLVPFVVDLWIKGQSMGHVFGILSDPSTWLIILGTSAIGQLIVAIVPQAMATVTLAHSESRIRTLKQNLEKLRESWGPDVGTTKPIDKLIDRD